MRFNPLNNSDIASIEAALSATRLATFIATVGGTDRLKAIELYEWNAEITSAFVLPLHISEVSMRNGVAEAIEAVYGSGWPWSNGFQQSLPSPTSGFNPRRELLRTLVGKRNAGQVIPELKFAFWCDMFTARHDQRLWNQNLRSSFKNVSSQASIAALRTAFYDKLGIIRKFRNRVAHHEPIYTRDLGADFTSILAVTDMRCAATATWMCGIQRVTSLLRQRP